MKKKWFAFFCAFVLCLSSAISMTACDFGNPNSGNPGGDDTEQGGDGEHNCATDGHKYGEWETVVEVTCEVDGEKEKVCSKCGDKQTQTISATGEHTYGEWKIATQPTCNANGEKEKVCSKCGDKQTQTISATGEHTYGEWETVMQASCGIAGSQEKTCSVCGDKQTQTTPAITKHTYQNKACATCGAKQPTEGLAYLLSDDESYYILTGLGTATDKDIVIADYYNELPVKEIEARAFASCKQLTSITILGNVERIQKYAFYNCANVTSIEVPDSVVYIGKAAFDKCDKLTYNEYENAYYLGDEETPYLILIKAKDKTVTSCVIHKNTKCIYDDAFYNCKKLEGGVKYSRRGNVYRREGVLLL